MATDYSHLYKEYPEMISADQLYRICHISKRKAKWLLDNGYIPCQDSGKKTRRYKIRLEDTIAYLRTLETDPKAVSAPVGFFNSKGSRVDPISQIDKEDFQQYLYRIWAMEPDALTAKDIWSMIGYGPGRIGKWMASHKLPSVKLPSSTKLVAKQWLVEFISEYTIENPNRLSDTNRQIARQYLEHR